jgi:hypothetical protein
MFGQQAKPRGGVATEICDGRLRVVTELLYAETTKDK